MAYSYCHKFWLNVYESVEILETESFCTTGCTDIVENALEIMGIVCLKHDYLLLHRFIMAMVKHPTEMGTPSSEALAKQRGNKKTPT